jgi:ribosomal protein S18 acetylase RimI-like enzyme
MWLRKPKSGSSRGARDDLVFANPPLSSTDLSLRLAQQEDAGAIHTLLASVGEALAGQGFDNWQPPYPIERIRAFISEREVWMVFGAGQLVASYTLGSTPPRPYEVEPWPEPTLPSLYLNRLAVDPARQGQGIGSWCLTNIVARARELGAAAIRCDVLEANPALRAFYELHGYVARGKRSHSGWSFVCYERLIP